LSEQINYLTQVSTGTFQPQTHNKLKVNFSSIQVSHTKGPATRLKKSCRWPGTDWNTPEAEWSSWRKSKLSTLEVGLLQHLEWPLNRPLLRSRVAAAPLYLQVHPQLQRSSLPRLAPRAVTENQDSFFIYALLKTIIFNGLNVVVLLSNSYNVSVKLYSRRKM
jgi:hypothetical protein